MSPDVKELVEAMAEEPLQPGELEVMRYAIEFLALEDGFTEMPVQLAYFVALMSVRYVMNRLRALPIDDGVDELLVPWRREHRDDLRYLAALAVRIGDEIVETLLVGEVSN